MNFTTILSAAFIALGFIAWPIIGKFAKAPGPWIAVGVQLFTAVIAGLISYRQLLQVLPTPRAWGLLGLAALINGPAVYLYSKNSVNPEIPTAAFLVLVAVLTVAFAPILDWALNGAVPSTRQGIGFVLAVVSIYFLIK